MLAVCLCGWLKSLETPEGNPPNLQRDSTAGGVGTLLVWTACIPYNTTPDNRPAHTNTASPTSMDEHATYRRVCFNSRCTPRFTLHFLLNGSTQDLIKRLNITL